MDEADRRRLLGLFVAEAEDALAVMSALAARFEARDDPTSVAELGGTAHSLKGAAAAVGLPELVWAIHRLEALAVKVGATPVSRRKADHARLLRAIDLLATAAATLGARGQLSPEEPALLRELLADVAPETPAPGQRPSPTDAPAAPAPAPDGGLERLSVPSSAVDEALRLASAVARLAAALRERSLELDDSSVSAPALELSLASERLEASLLRLRMIPAAESLAGLDGEVQSLAARLGKEVRTVIEDRGVRADRRTLQAARGMIRHLVRNAVDHGIEAPAERAAQGKPGHGLLRISMAMAESRLEVSVADDGRGFDLPAVRRKLAQSRGDEASVATLSDDEALTAFAISGGSTREEATEISGRGMGLSAVVSLVRARGGDFRVRSERGKGSSTALTVPLEVYSLEVLTVTDDGLCLGLPVASVEQTFVLKAGGVTIQRGPTGPILPLDERLVHLRSIGVVRGRSQPRPEQRFAVVVRSEGRQAAFSVDQVGETTRVAPQAVPPWVRPDALVTGVSLLPDGRQLQLLNPLRLVSLVHEAVAEPVALSRPTPTPAAAPAPSKARLRLLLAEDSLATREVLRVLLERDGFEVRVAADGDEALAAIDASLPDVVVSDFSMPRCDGPTLTRRLRASPRTARLPVVLLTSRNDERSRAEGAAAGADAYLIKSDFNATVLRATLKGLGVEGA